MKKQTAVEWLYEILTTENWEYKTYEEQNEIFQKAKQMEKEQIEKAKSDGYDEAMSEAIKEIHKYYKPI